MIDNITLSIPEAVSPQLENEEYGWGGQIKGNLENLKIIQYPDRIYCTGSLAKYLHGENVTTLTRKQVKTALEKLESKTGWNLKNAILKKLEIGCTLPVSQPVNEYLALIGQLPRNTFITFKKKTLETVYNSTGNRTFIAYDKGIEARKNIPAYFEGMNLIRLELKYKKQIEKYLGSLSPWDITEKEQYRILVDNFKEFYFSIPKKRIPVLDITDECSPKDIDNMLKLAGLEYLGSSFLDKIESLEKSGKLSRADRVRKSIRDLKGNLKYSEPEELIQELDSKIISQVMYV